MKALVSNRSIVTRLINASRAQPICGQGGRVQDDVPIPTISSNEILVKVKAVALNPTDFKHLDILSPSHSIIGCDYAGVVHKVGDSVKDKWQVGDRVAGAVHGGLYPDKGSFAEYLKTDADLAWRVPDKISDTDATTYGVSAVTAMLTLNIHHELPFLDTRPSIPKNEAVFIYAGATSAGLYHIELAKAVGYRVVTTASPRSFDLVKKYGADAVFDYNSLTVAADIVKEYPKITKAVDCFSEGKSTSICAAVLKPSGGKVITLLPNGKSSTRGVSYDLVMSYTAFGHPFQWLPPIGPKFEARPQDRAALVRFCEILPNITHILKPIPTVVLENGFDGVLEGLNKLRAGQTTDDSCWPSTKTWSALNSTINGHFIRYTPPGAVCYKSHPSYNAEACDSVIKHEWLNAGCIPVFENGTSIYGDPESGERGCSNDVLPAYVVNATTTDYVAVTLKFAAEKNIRLVIKNTGHAGDGRIWTHNLKGIELIEDFNSTCPNSKDAPSPRMAATVGAGVRDGEMVEALAAMNALAVSGTSNDVGVAGRSTGGGHEFATGHYGQGADSIPEAEIVTPSGKVVIANECQNEDLYWAIRGGGGGTIGVITRLTLKAYPAPQMVMAEFDISIKNHSSEDEWYQLIAEAHALFPAIQDAGIHGYYTVEGPPSAEALTFSGSLMMFEASSKTYEDAIRPFAKLLESSNDTVASSLYRLPVNNWQGLLKILPDIGSVSAGHSIRTSRMISRRTVIEKSDEFAAVYEKIGPTKKAPSNGLPNLSISGTLTISPKPVNNSLHPSWRNTTVHLITGQAWTDSANETEIRSMIHDMTYRKLGLLRDLDAVQGAYLNEARFKSFFQGYEHY
ncbi:unnamed protein product [Fusarium langsethiae]|nr:unnamed protein product [Fusarium langsethiae]